MELKLPGLGVTTMSVVLKLGFLKKLTTVMSTLWLNSLLLFSSFSPNRSVGSHPWRSAVMTLLSSAITAAVNGILVALKADNHIVLVDWQLTFTPLYKELARYSGSPWLPWWQSINTNQIELPGTN